MDDKKGHQDYLKAEVFLQELCPFSAKFDDGSESIEHKVDLFALELL